MACYSCLRGWRASVGDVVACLRGWRGWRACVGGVLAWVTWVACLREWRASVSGVGGVRTSIDTCYWQLVPFQKSLCQC